MRLNLFQYSLPSETLALSHENSAGLDQLRADLHKEHQPIDTTEELLVNEMAEQYWRLRRARAMETRLLDSDKVVIAHLTAMQRMMSSAERGFHKALTALRQLQKDRGFVPTLSEPAKPDQHEPPLSEPRPKEAVTTGSRSESASALGFVPPSCPADEEIDPADWARAFETRNKIWNKQHAA